MIQIYFLSIISNLVAGLALISGDNKDTQEEGVFRLGIFLNILRDKKFRLVLGIIAMAAGVLKILSPAEGNIIILGDLFPSAAGIASGLILFFENFSKTKNDDSEDIIIEDKTQNLSLLFKNRKLIGFAAIAAAVLHFVFPGVFLL